MERLKDLLKKYWELEIEGNARWWYFDHSRLVVVLNLIVNVLFPVAISLYATTQYIRNNTSLAVFIFFQAFSVYYEARSLATILKAWLIRREKIYFQDNNFGQESEEKFKRQNREKMYMLLKWSVLGFGTIAVAEGIMLGAGFNVLFFIGLITIVATMFFDSKWREFD